ncbi:glycosyltransferase family 2 protein [Spirosoma linguale]|uniref:Glycosyl transferase family 2 n=1 Tax=Spirosoma linguale (strain ATCC 33905 / DSM 74 / LMG 10896 / Claus 1) TaxID=504472 RepID=D2QGH6_SPILD|nr:glycosyl transferase family 2 [Spirosoma linguale DSM 74]
MDRIPLVPPTIQPINELVHRPLWSVMIPAYNCASFLEETLLSVLAQDLGEDQMQIEVVDDASTDADVEALVATLGKGRVSYYRQPHNVGSLRNFETCLNRSRGHLVHLLHGDDRVRPGFYTKMGGLFTAFPTIGAAACRYAYIDAWGNDRQCSDPERPDDGLLDNWLIRIAQQDRLQYVSMVVKRSVYEHLGAFYGVTYGEDWEMWVRIARCYSFAYTPEVLAEYRGRPQSISDQKMATGHALRDLRSVIAVIQNYLPDDDKQAVLRHSKSVYVRYGMYGAFNAWKDSGNTNYILGTIREAYRLYSGPSFYRILTKVLFKFILYNCALHKPKRENLNTEPFYLSDTKTTE